MSYTPVDHWTEAQCRQYLRYDKRATGWETATDPEHDQRPSDKLVQAEIRGHGLYILAFGKTHLQALRAACKQLQEWKP